MFGIGVCACCVGWYAVYRVQSDFNVKNEIEHREKMGGLISKPLRSSSSIIHPIDVGSLKEKFIELSGSRQRLIGASLRWASLQLFVLVFSPILGFCLFIHAIGPYDQSYLMACASNGKQPADTHCWDRHREIEQFIEFNLFMAEMVPLILIFIAIGALIRRRVLVKRANKLHYEIVEVVRAIAEVQKTSFLEALRWLG